MKRTILFLLIISLLSSCSDSSIRNENKQPVEPTKPTENKPVDAKTFRLSGTLLKGDGSPIVGETICVAKVGAKGASVIGYYDDKGNLANPNAETDERGGFTIDIDLESNFIMASDMYKMMAGNEAYTVVTRDLQKKRDEQLKPLTNKGTPLLFNIEKKGGQVNLGEITVMER